MTRPMRIALLGNAPPRRCGIATFTCELQEALGASGAGIETSMVAMNDRGRRYDYPPNVRIQIDDDRLGDYIRASDALNAGQYDVVSLQHEFGIFGGEAGEHVMALLSRLTMPIVTTFHTVLSAPTPQQRRVAQRIIDASARIVVMAEKGRAVLQASYQIPPSKIEVIAHGIPDVAFIEPAEAKARLGFSGRQSILTFGLLSPNKGIEMAIDAMPEILARCPSAVYVVLGATHPNLVRDQGEAYRDSLVARVHALGIANSVVFLDRFVDQQTLLGYIAMCDVYVTPYLNEAQMTSGTLAYSFGLGKPVVSTPYWHARELLADGRGVLVPFADPGAIGREVSALLTDHPRRQAMRERAYAASRCMTWARTAERYLAVFESARADHRPAVTRGQPHVLRPVQARPEMQTEYLLAMCDDTGLFQHAVFDVPDRAHGYCVDDNARGLLVACALNGPGERPLDELVTARFAAFVQHAWNPDTRRFRNFMGFDRRWLEETGSEDSHGRTVWALGNCARSDASPSRRRWAAALFAMSLPPVEHFQSPRAWAFALLGLDAYCAAVPDDASAQRLRLVLGARLMARLAAAETPDWVWFEDGLAYDNARLPQALIVTGVRTGQKGWVAAGLRTLRWLMGVQTAPTGCFRPVGTEGFGQTRCAPQVFDQQPLEATATIAACLAAWRAEGDAIWTDYSERAFSWFLGHNDLAVPVVDVDTGSCRDGLHSDRASANRGAESVVSYLLALAEMRQLARASAGHTLPPPPRMRRARPAASSR
jgi:glycosyltransferase involved in cell wall biosynthesis